MMKRLHILLTLCIIICSCEKQNVEYTEKAYLEYRLISVSSYNEPNLLERFAEMGGFDEEGGKAVISSFTASYMDGRTEYSLSAEIPYVVFSYSVGDDCYRPSIVVYFTIDDFRMRSMTEQMEDVTYDTSMAPIQIGGDLTVSVRNVTARGFKLILKNDFCSIGSNDFPQELTYTFYRELS